MCYIFFPKWGVFINCYESYQEIVSEELRDLHCPGHSSCSAQFFPHF